VWLFDEEPRHAASYPPVHYIPIQTWAKSLLLYQIALAANDVTVNSSLLIIIHSVNSETVERLFRRSYSDAKGRPLIETGGL
jgi:hypothetical protein